MATIVLVPTPVGDLIDKITILRIKLAQIADPAKRANVGRELALLERLYADTFPEAGSETERLAADLQAVNQELWTIEDDIRDCENRHDFSDTFIALARSVYRTNDRRAALKRDLNVALGSALIEEKSYASH